MTKTQRKVQNRKEKSLSRTGNMRNFTTPIFQNAGIRIHTIRLWSIAWDYRKIPGAM